MTGKVKFYDETKGFGFITPDNAESDVFVHRSGLKCRITENDNVSFDIENGVKGVNAVNVQLV